MSLSHLGRTVGVILAGGASQRMGTPKHALRTPSGLSYTEAIASAMREALQSVASPPRIIVAGVPSDADPIAGLECFPDRERLGPLAGLDGAMIALAGKADHLLVAPCDMPTLRSATLRALLVPTDAAITLFADTDGRPQPLPMRIALVAAPVVAQRLHGTDRSLRGLVSVLSSLIVDCPAPDELRSINTPEQRTAYETA